MGFERAAALLTVGRWPAAARQEVLLAVEDRAAIAGLASSLGTALFRVSRLIRGRRGQHTLRPCLPRPEPLADSRWVRLRVSSVSSTGQLPVFNACKGSEAKQQRP